MLSAFDVAYFGEETKNSYWLQFKRNLLMLKEDDKKVFFVYFVALEFVCGI